jgi:hypothetical protein
MEAWRGRRNGQALGHDTKEVEWQDGEGCIVGSMFLTHLRLSMKYGARVYIVALPGKGGK